MDHTNPRKNFVITVIYFNSPKALMKQPRWRGMWILGQGWWNTQRHFWSILRYLQFWSFV